jgi:hypothetical protein
VLKFDNNAVTCAIAGLALIPTMTLAIDAYDHVADKGTRLLPASRKLVPADAAGNCEGLTGKAKGLCLAYNSGVKTEMAKATLANQYLEEFGEVVPGMGLTPFPNRSVLDEALIYVNDPGEWNGVIDGIYYGDNITNWDVSHVTDFSALFWYTSTVNEDISSWDVSSGEDFSQMFKRATNFNQDISSWDVSSGTDFSQMFEKAEVFNQDISAWNVSSGTIFLKMFHYAKVFNQSIGAWDVSSGEDFSQMFEKAEFFNQDISAWNVSSGTIFFTCFVMPKSSTKTSAPGMYPVEPILAICSHLPPPSTKT